MYVPPSIRNLVISSFIVVMITVLVMMALGRNHDGFAQCLSQKGVKLYVKADCPDCVEQEATFGRSARYLTKVMCDKKTDCSHIDGFPGWEFTDGGQVVGVQEFKQLAALSGCKI